MVLEDEEFKANMPASDTGPLAASSNGRRHYYKRESYREGRIKLRKGEGDQRPISSF